MSSIKELEERIKAAEDERRELFRKKAPIDARLTKLYNEIDARLTKLYNEIEAMKDQIKVKGGKAGWEWLLSEDRTGNRTKSKERERKLEKIGLSSGGYFPATDQVCIEVKLTKGSKKSLKDTVRGLKFILKYLKPLEDGKIHIKIFENTLSEYGVYTLLIDNTRWTVSLTKTTYGRTSELTGFATLEEAIRYIQKHHWYDEAEDNV